MRLPDPGAPSGPRRQLLTRNGNDLAHRFPTAVAAIAALPVRSCIIDGEAIVCDESGLAVFDLVRGHVRNARALLCAFDLLQLDGDDIRREPIQERKRRLGELLKRPHAGIALNHHFAEDGAIIFKHACALGCEGIVSKRLGSPYRAGRWRPARNGIRRVSCAAVMPPSRWGISGPDRSFIAQPLRVFPDAP